MITPRLTRVINEVKEMNFKELENLRKMVDHIYIQSAIARGKK